MARRVWMGRQCRAILNDPAFVCQHGAEDPCECKQCRKCVTAFVREHEPELRSRVRSSWPAKTAAASAARDLWRRQHEAAARDDGAGESASAGEQARHGDSRDAGKARGTSAAIGTKAFRHNLRDLACRFAHRSVKLVHVLLV